MNISNNGISLIKRHEGCMLKAYRCPAGVLTIGYGHTAGVRQGDVITASEAERMLIADVKLYEAAVRAEVPATISQNRFDALVSFCYNVGPGNFKRSTLLRKLKANPDDPAIAGEFAKWTGGSGKTLPGLVKRRKEEAELYFKC